MLNAGQESNDRHSFRQKPDVLAALDSIPEIYRLPLWFRFCLGFGAAETAETLAIPEQTLPSLIAVGLQRLSRTLEVMNPFHDIRALPLALAAVPAETAPLSLLAELGALANQSMTPRKAPRPAGSGSAGQVLPFLNGLSLGDFADIRYN